MGDASRTGPDRGRRRPPPAPLPLHQILAAQELAVLQRTDLVGHVGRDVHHVAGFHDALLLPHPGPEPPAEDVDDLLVGVAVEVGPRPPGGRGVVGRDRLLRERLEAVERHSGPLLPGQGPTSSLTRRTQYWRAMAHTASGRTRAMRIHRPWTPVTVPRSCMKRMWNSSGGKASSTRMFTGRLARTASATPGSIFPAAATDA